MRRYILLMLAVVWGCGTPESNIEEPFGRSNTAPSLASAEIAESTYKKESVITVTPRGWSDADGDPEWYEYQWYVDDRPVPGQTVASLTGEFFEKGSVVYCQVTPRDLFGAGLPVNSNAVKVGNTEPRLHAAAFTAGLLTSGMDLTLTPLDPTDPDGDPIVYEVAWYVNGQLVMGEAGLTLPRTYYSRGDEVYAVVTPYDGTVPGAATTTQTVTIQNALPVITSAALSSGPHDKRNPIGALAAASDADADPLTYQFRWYVNGVSIPSATGSFLSPTAFKRGDSVFFEARAHDGITFGVWLASNVGVVTNAPPVIVSTPTLYPTHVSTSDPIWVTPPATTDADGDSVTLAYTWYKNGVAQAFASAATAVISNPVTYYTRPGDVWNVDVMATDGTNATAASSTGITVQKVRFREIAGNGSSLDSSVGTPINFSRCAIDTRDALWCWGDIRQKAPWAIPYAVTATTPKRHGGHWKTLSTHAKCAINTDGTLWCWNDTNGNWVLRQLGSQNDWVKVVESSITAQTAPGGSTLCATNTVGEVWCWGRNYYGGLGHGITTPTLPTQITSSTEWTAFSISERHTCAVKDAALWCWGDNQMNSIGFTETCVYNPAPSCYHPWPVQVTTTTGWIDVAAGEFSSCALRNDGTLWCWGLLNDAGSPTPINADTDWVEVETGGSNICAKKSSGAVFCWGRNDYGALGRGNRLQSDTCSYSPMWVSFACSKTPTVVSNVSDFTKVAVFSDYGACGIREDQSLWCWGSNHWGELGVGIPLGTGTPEDYALKGPETDGDQSFSTVPYEVYQ